MRLAAIDTKDKDYKSGLRAVSTDVLLHCPECNRAADLYQDINQPNMLKVACSPEHAALSNMSIGRDAIYAPLK